ncbi:MAG: 50S ribosomal protein L21 [Bacteroidetes bacterium]|nr:50S ribosomal protein L21 [Bacteroidota bacterium]
MYAIVEIGGQQFKVEKDQEINVNRLEGKEGAKIDFDQVMLLDNKGKVTIGTPIVVKAKVKATILEHLKGDKVIVFKKKRRKGYQVKRGYRASLTRIKIDNISN